MLLIDSFRWDIWLTPISWCSIEMQDLGYGSKEWLLWGDKLGNYSFLGRSTPELKSFLSNRQITMFGPKSLLLSLNTCKLVNCAVRGSHAGCESGREEGEMQLRWNVLEECRSDGDRNNQEWWSAKKNRALRLLWCKKIEVISDMVRTEGSGKILRGRPRYV